jgi:hypothetical protein
MVYSSRRRKRAAQEQGTQVGAGRVGELEEVNGREGHGLGLHRRGLPRRSRPEVLQARLRGYGQTGRHAHTRAEHRIIAVKVKLERLKPQFVHGRRCDKAVRPFAGGTLDQVVV